MTRLRSTFYLLSLLCCIALCALWVRSLTTRDALRWYQPDPRLITIEADSGRLSVTSYPTALIEIDPSSYHLSHAVNPTRFSPGSPWFYRDPYTLTFPIALIIPPTAFPPALWLIRKRRLKKSQGFPVETLPVP